LAGTFQLNRQRNFAPMQHCLLICRALHLPAKRALYGALSVPLLPDIADSMLVQITKAVHADAETARLVKSLRVHMDQWHAGGWNPVGYASFPAPLHLVLNTCHNLTALQLIWPTTCCLGSSDLHFSLSLTQLTHFAVEARHDNLPRLRDLAACLEALPNLVSLSYDHFPGTAETATERVDWPKLAKLRHLKLGGDAPTLYSLFGFVLTNGSGVESLTLKGHEGAYEEVELVASVINLLLACFELLSESSTFHLRLEQGPFPPLHLDNRLVTSLSISESDWVDAIDSLPRLAALEVCDIECALEQANFQRDVAQIRLVHPHWCEALQEVMCV
jgi:hypothetical protein